jgi:plasmid stabilization system protein ParE
MAYEIVVMPAAQVDLDAYTERLAALASRQQAQAWLAGAWEKIFSLAVNPRRFAVIDEAEEIGADVRDMLHFSHRIVYQVRESDQVVEILRMYHTARAPLTAQDIH